LLRLNQIIAGAAAGVAAGVAAWFAAGGASANVEKLAPAGQKLRAVHAPSLHDAAPPMRDLMQLAGNPIFPLSIGPGAVQEPAVRLDGLSITPRRAAALLSINNQPDAWLVAGETRDGVTVQEVTRSAVVVETVLGSHSIELGGASTPSMPPAMPAPALAQAAPMPPAMAPARDDVPRGFPIPPPPASARR
jgi:hypothetical protein